jgi:hypothetical protein
MTKKILKNFKNMSKMSNKSIDEQNGFITVKPLVWVTPDWVTNFFEFITGEPKVNQPKFKSPDITK